MYENDIKNLTSKLKIKRKEAVKNLSEAIKNDPEGVVEALLSVYDRAWVEIEKIINSNREGVFLSLLKYPPDAKIEKFLIGIGYMDYKEPIRSFYNYLNLAKKYKIKGIPVEYKTIYEEFLSGDVEEALNKIKKLVKKAHRMMEIIEDWKEVKKIADKIGIEIPDIASYIDNMDLDGAKKMLNSVDRKALMEKMKLLEEKEEIRNLLDKLHGAVGSKELIDRLQSANDMMEVKEIKKEAIILKNKVNEILRLYDDKEVRNLIKVNLKEAEKKAKIKKIAGIISLNFDREDFKKYYPRMVYGVHGFEVDGKVYIVVGEGEYKKYGELHVYDEKGKLIFKKRYKGAVWSVYGFKGKNGIYIIAGTSRKDKSVYVYNLNGKRLFKKSFKGSVNGVHGFEVDGKVYIVVGEGEYKKYGELHVYDEKGKLIFKKSYSAEVVSVNGFEDYGKIYIIDGTGRGSSYLHVYDKLGNLIFKKKSKGPVWRVYGFKGVKESYILIGSAVETHCGYHTLKIGGELRIYDMTGKKVLNKKYEGPIYTVYGFKAFNKDYIVTGGVDKTLYIYDLSKDEVIKGFVNSIIWDSIGFEAKGIVYVLLAGFDRYMRLYMGIDPNVFSSFIEWGFSVGIIDGRVFDKILSYGNKYELLVAVGELIKEIREKKSEYNKMEEEWSNIAFKLLKIKNELVNAGVKVDIPDRPVDYELLKTELPKLKAYKEKMDNVLFEYINLKKKYKKYSTELKDYSKVLGKYGIKIDIPLMAGTLEDLRTQVKELERDAGRYKKIAEEYPGLKKEWIMLKKKINKLREELKGSGVEMDIELGEGYEELKKGLPEVRGKVKELEIIASKYRNMKSKWNDLSGILKRYKDVLKGSGIEVEVPEMPTGITELEESLKELERDAGRYKKIAEEYQKLKEKWVKIKEEIDKLRNAGADIELKKTPQKLDELKSEIKRMSEFLRKYSKDVKIKVEVKGKIMKGEWSKAEIIVKNVGNIRAEDVKMEFTGGSVKIKGYNRVGILPPKSEKSVNIRLLSKETGYIPVELKMIYKNAYSGKTMSDVIYPEIYVKREKDILGGVGMVTSHIGISSIKKIYGKTETDNIYKWGNFTNYHISRKIGSGGFSDVYLIDKDGKNYAMKIPKGVDIKGDETIVLSRKDMENYGKEAELWAMLTEREPESVVNLIDAGIQPFPWFVMELAEYSLRYKIHDLSYEERIKVVVELLEKLDKIHHYGVVHKDIKPENILYVGGEWKFTDFGLSKVLSKSSKSSRLISGTLVYMAPEQISKKKFGSTDWRTDIWQMGVMIYELLTEHLPFEADDAFEITIMVMHETPVSAVEYGVSEEVWRVIEKALQKNKEKRWQSAAEMKDVLLQILSNENRR